jgi:predicted TIM-barrel fold metal-dependent hydrolase
VDHHCHPLRRWSARLEAADLRSCFSETLDARVIADHVPNTAVYRLAMRRLAPMFGCRPTEAAVLTARQMLEPSRFARELLERSLTGMMLLDAGYITKDAMTFQEHRASVPVPQREIVRIESLAEDLVEAFRRPEDWLDAVRVALEEAVRDGAVAVKTIVAYRASLRLRWPDPRDVREDYAMLRNARRAVGGAGRSRLAGNPLCHALVFVAAEECVRLGIPLQVHCGIGDTDSDLAEASPLGLRELVTHPRFADLQVALLHCYPFHREAAYMCSVYAGVHMDLSLAIPLAVSDGVRAMGEVLGMCPWTKLLYATDAGRLPELFLVAAELHREALAAAFGEMVTSDILALDEAKEAGRMVLAGNARRLYRL